MTPPIVFIMIGHSAGKMMTASSVSSEKLNNSSASGRNAMPGIGRKISIVARP